MQLLSINDMLGKGLERYVKRKEGVGGSKCYTHGVVHVCVASRFPNVCARMLICAWIKCDVKDK